MKRKKESFYKNSRTLKTAFEGYEDQSVLDKSYHRQDDKKELQEALEEAEESHDDLH